MIEENYDLYIQQHQAVIVLFGSLSCHPCQALKTRLILWQKEHQQVMFQYLSVDEHTFLEAQHLVLSVPTIVVYINGQETLRQTGYFSLDTMLKKVERYLEIC